MKVEEVKVSMFNAYNGDNFLGQFHSEFAAKCKVLQSIAKLQEGLVGNIVNNPDAIKYIKENF